MAHNPKTPDQGFAKRSDQAGNSEKNEGGGAFTRRNKPGPEREVNPDKEVDDNNEQGDKAGGQPGKDGGSKAKLNTKTSKKKKEEDTALSSEEEDQNEESDEEKDEDADDEAIGLGTNDKD
jgi:hypothetical protein